MALPKVTSTVYEMKIPSTNERVKFRPFLVKEQKALMLAQQSNDATTLINTLKDVISSCVLDKIDVNTLAIFDLEYMLLQLRSKSIEERATLSFKCDSCEHETDVTLDVTNISVDIPNEHTNKIMINDEIGICMKYPSIDIIKKLETLSESSMDSIFEVVMACIDYIFDAEQLYYAKEQTKEELTSFINSLSTEQFNRVKEFFNTMPFLKHELVFKCPECGHEHNKVIKGINNFF